MADNDSVTQLLGAWRAGDQQAGAQLVPLVYGELRKRAGQLMARERADHTLQATALVHEAWIRLADAEVSWADRAHFYALAARQMRRVLVDHAREKLRDKRGGGAVHVELDQALEISGESAEQILELNDALKRLAAFDRRKAEMVELNYFGGLSYEETGEVLGLSPATVHRELRLAKAWLYREMGSG